MTTHLKRVLREVHRRSLWQVLGVYVVASWFVLQVVDTLTSVLQLPDWFPSFALVLLFVGLPIVLATAFVQVGVRARDGHLPVDPDTEGEKGGQGAREVVGSPDERGLGKLLTWRNALGGGVLAFALWGVIAAGWILAGGGRGPGVEAPDGPPGIAVLPLVNRSADDSDAFFTDGLHDELLTQLSKVAGIRVISRTSVMGYRDTDLTIPEIADQLSVEYVFEGGVLRAGDQIRLNAQLIHGPTDGHVWADTYDRAMTVENLLAIQSEIVQSIVRELRAAISPAESSFVASMPTDDTEAYELYLRGEDWLNRGGLSEEEYANAARFHEEAAALDADFALAHAKASSAHVRMYFQGHDVTPARLGQAEASIERARELDPDHPEVREAHGDFLYYGRRDYDPALAEYQAALERLPNSATLMARIAWIQRRKGLWEESLAGLERVRAMDPRSGSNLMNHGVSLYAMRRYGEAAETFDRAVVFNPGMDLLWSLRVQNEHARGDTAAAVAMLREAPEAVLRESFTAGARLEVLRLRRDYRGLRDRVLATEDEVVGAAGSMRILALYLGWAYQGLGEPDRAREAFREALSVAERLADEQPGDFRLPGAVGLALAELGRGEDAVASGRRGMEILGPTDDALWGYNTVWALAQIHGRLGEADAAIDLIEQAMSAPNQAAHTGLLKLDPLFDSIRDHPRFQALLEEHADGVER